ncbi:MAG: hypothetical protein RL755_1257 [Pseudomonadota bacterium]|jgi:uncharacterized membrane protein YedE/YeeE
MENFTPYSALIGGCFIGLSAALLLFFNGRVAGISGIIVDSFSAEIENRYWRGFFLIGLMFSAAIINTFFPVTAVTYSRHILLVVVSGILVGYGVRLGNGCTSGHAVCGLARLSLRSVVATLTFMSAAMLTTYIMRHVLGY